MPTLTRHNYRDPQFKDPKIQKGTMITVRMRDRLAPMDGGALAVSWRQALLQVILQTHSWGKPVPRIQKTYHGGPGQVWVSTDPNEFDNQGTRSQEVREHSRDPLGFGHMDGDGIGVWVLQRRGSINSTAYIYTMFELCELAEIELTLEYHANPVRQSLNPQSPRMQNAHGDPDYEDKSPFFNAEDQ